MDKPTNGAEEATEFFDAHSETKPITDPNGPEQLSPEERAELEAELKKTEDEIGTLRQVLASRMKHASELKHKLGISVWSEVGHDLGQSFKTVKESNAYQKTTDMFHQTGDAMSKKIGQLKNSSYYKSFEEKIGTAYGSVKAKMTASTSIDQLSGRAKGESGGASGSATVPPTPSQEKSPLA